MQIQDNSSIEVCVQTSTEIGEIAKSLLAVQKALKPIPRSGVNPHFKSQYLTLGDIVEAALPLLNANGILLLQSTASEDDAGFNVVTRLQHVSGQFIEGQVRMPMGKATAQEAGSGVSYGRRYSLATLLGIVAEEDDDGNAATTAAPRNGNLGDVAQKVFERIPAPKTQAKGPSSVDGIPKSCPKCGGKVWDNRAKKASGEFKANGPDWSCADKECKTGKFRTAGWVEEKGDAFEDIPVIDDGDPGPDKPGY